MKKLLPFFIAFLLIFYVLPLIIKTSVILLAASPILILIVSLIYGAFYGSYLAIKRILRCNPFGSSGYDPVPIKKEKKYENQH